MSTVKHTMKCSCVRRTTRVADVSFACYFLLSRYFFHCHRCWVCFLFVYLLILNKYPVLVIWFSVCGQVPKNGTKSNQSLNTQAFKMKAVVFFLILLFRPFHLYIWSLTISRRINSFHILWFFYVFHLIDLVYPRLKRSTLNTSLKPSTVFVTSYIMNRNDARLEMFKRMENTQPTIHKWKLKRKNSKISTTTKKLDWILKKFNGFYSFSVIMVLKNKLWTHRLSKNGARFSHVQ